MKNKTGKRYIHTYIQNSSCKAHKHWKKHLNALNKMGNNEEDEE